MEFQLNVTLTEEDYLAFNVFHALESITGIKQIRKSRFFFAAIMTIMMVLFLFILEFSTFAIIYAVLVGLFSILYISLFKKIMKRNIKAQVKRLKKTGKLPFDPVAKYEFYDDKFVGITPDARVEQSYDALERICVMKNQYVFLYSNSVNAYILPIPQLREQLEQEKLLNFLSQKCNTVEFY